MTAENPQLAGVDDGPGDRTPVPPVGYGAGRDAGAPGFGAGHGTGASLPGAAGRPEAADPRTAALQTGPRAALEAVRTGVAKAVVGQDSVVTGLVICLLCRGHALLEGVPGVAKTLLVRALAGTLSLRSTRVQFTADLMPCLLYTSPSPRDRG